MPWTVIQVKQGDCLKTFRVADISVNTAGELMEDAEPLLAPQNSVAFFCHGRVIVSFKTKSELDDFMLFAFPKKEPCANFREIQRNGKGIQDDKPI